MSYSLTLTFLLLTRFISEIINSFVWEKANYVWSTLALISIALFSWRFLLSEIYKEKNIFNKYSPIFLYLLYLILRLNLYNIYSLKCFFSEFILWCIFIYTVEISCRDFNTRKIVELWIIRLVKIIVLIGVIQIAVCSFSEHSFNPLYLVQLRPVRGIFAHQNIFLVTMLPFLFYFIKKRLYYWVPLVLISCIGTGTRGPFLALACMSILVLKSISRKKIRWSNIFFTLAVIVFIYSMVILSYSPGTTAIPQEESRFYASSLQWRIRFWKNFIEASYDFPTFIGNGIGSADNLAADLMNIPLFYPHSDYIRIYYDTGVIGLLFFANLIFFMLRLIKKTTTTDNDFILLSYLIIICFYITDNFIYCTHSIFIYMFIAIFLIGNNKSGAINESIIVN